MAGSARLDSGAEAIILRRSTVESHNLPTSTGADTTVMFGNGHTTTTNTQTSLGGLPAIVCEDHSLHEDLISVNPLLDSGYTLTMTGRQGTLTNEEDGSSIQVVREGAKWSVDIRDLSEATQPAQLPEGDADVRDVVEAHAVINMDAKSLRERVISIHEASATPTPKPCAMQSEETTLRGPTVISRLLRYGG